MWILEECLRCLLAVDKAWVVWMYEWMSLWSIWTFRGANPGNHTRVRLYPYVVSNCSLFSTLLLIGASNGLWVTPYWHSTYWGRVQKESWKLISACQRLSALVRSTQRKQVEADQAKCRIMPVVIMCYRSCLLILNGSAQRWPARAEACRNLSAPFSAYRRAFICFPARVTSAVKCR
jgi:hypothetical protein